MTKKKTKKGGFTLVELVIVILVIAILAAILIPTFVSLTKKAKMSADEQIVAGINIALTAEEISNGKPSTIEAVNIILTENGYRAPISPSSSDHEFYWIAADNRVVLVKMNGETPESIVYPKELAAKYKLRLPANGEWFKLGDAGCKHTDIEYRALADENGGSTNHIGVCKICNNVMAEKEKHDTKGEGGACSKCGYKAHTHTYTDYEAVGNGEHLKKCSGCDAAILENCSFPDGSNTCEHCGYVKPGSGEHAHNFTYKSNNNGTHTIACNASDCPGFGETTANCTYDAETGKCVFCGYLKPEDKHVHVYKYTPHLTDGEYDGKHTIMCTAPGCTGIGETIKNCAYDATTGKCIFCGASKPVAPIIYKPLLILTETATDDILTLDTRSVGEDVAYYKVAVSFSYQMNGVFGPYTTEVVWDSRNGDIPYCKWIQACTTYEWSTIVGSQTINWLDNSDGTKWSMQHNAPDGTYGCNTLYLGALEQLGKEDMNDDHFNNAMINHVTTNYPLYIVRAYNKSGQLIGENQFSAAQFDDANLECKVDGKTVDQVRYSLNQQIGMFTAPNTYKLNTFGAFKYVYATKGSETGWFDSTSMAPESSTFDPKLIGLERQNNRWLITGFSGDFASTGYTIELSTTMHFSESKYVYENGQTINKPLCEYDVSYTETVSDNEAYKTGFKYVYATGTYSASNEQITLYDKDGTSYVGSIKANTSSYYTIQVKNKESGSSIDKGTTLTLTLTVRDAEDNAVYYIKYTKNNDTSNTLTEQYRGTELPAAS